MTAFRRILVAVGDPGSRAQAAIAKAVRLARRTGASVELFHSLFDPFVQGERMYANRALARDIDTLVASTRERLEQRAAEAATARVNVRCTVHWDYPSHEAIVRQAVRHKADLVIAESRRRHGAARLFLSNTDWQLIRLCPVPLILVKNSRAWTDANILAAVDPLHAHAKPTALDPRILKIGAEFARALGAQLHAVHAHSPLIGYVPGLMTEPLPVRITGREARDHHRQVRQRVLAETRRFRTPERRVHVVEGEPGAVLIGQARRLRAQMVIMGAVSRSGLQRLFIGSTAERVIDDLSCDVCVVKPPGFRNTVPARPRHLPVMVPPP